MYLGVMLHAYNPSNAEVGAGESQIPGQSGLHKWVQDQPDCTAVPCLSINKKIQARCWWLKPIILAIHEAENIGFKFKTSS
jgi:hypothetical protein